MLAKYTHLQSGDSERRGGGVGRERRHSAACRDKGADGGVHNEVADSSRERGDLFFFFRHTDSNAHSEEQGEVVEYNAASSAHNAEYGIEQTALADNVRQPIGFKGRGVGKGASDSEQESRHGKQGDGEHKRASDSLKHPEYLVFHKIFSFEKAVLVVVFHIFGELINENEKRVDGGEKV